MNIEEATETLEANNAPYQTNFETGKQPYLNVYGLDIYFGDDGAYYEIREYDYCKECGSPKKFEREYKKLTMEELKTMITTHKERQL